MSMWQLDKVVVNRRAKKIETMFDGKVIEFEPFERKQLPARVAYNIIPNLPLQLDIASGIVTVFSLGIEGDDSYPIYPLEGSLASTDPVELLDRTNEEPMVDSEPKVLSQGEAVPVGVGKAEVKVKKAALVSTGVVTPRGPMLAGSGDYLTHKNLG